MGRKKESGYDRYGEDPIKPTQQKDPIACSFCGRRSDKHPQYIVTGPGVNICEDCVELCNQVIEQKRREDRRG